MNPQQKITIRLEAYDHTALDQSASVIVETAKGVVLWEDVPESHQAISSTTAFLMADMAHVAGLIAAGVYPNPVGIAPPINPTTIARARSRSNGMS